MTRSTSILIRVTPEEADSFKATAARAGLGVGPWIRSLGVKEAARVGRIDEMRCPECRHLTGTSLRGHRAGCSRALVSR